MTFVVYGLKSQLKKRKKIQTKLEHRQLLRHWFMENQ